MGTRLRATLAALTATLALACLAGTATAGTVPAGFQETTAFTGLTNPTVVRFAPDGKVIVAEKSGLIKIFDGLNDPTATIWADLRTQVHNFWDRGLLGMALSPRWNEYPWIYVLYARDAAVGGTAPRWGTPGTSSDPCPTPPGPTSDGCVVSGRLSRLVPLGDGTVREDPLIDDWCQQYPSHSVGSLEFDPWHALYISGGDGASFTFADWGQDGSPLNPCGDPPGGAGATLAPPSAEGGALRSQDIRTSGDPAGLDGSVLRVDARDGSGLSINPMFGSSNANERRIIATGLRNPFRFAVSETGEVWAGDVGWNTWEEINRVPYTGLRNFGWPCYEGNARQSGYDSANLSICENLYGAPAATTAPYYAYDHAAKVVTGETCPSGSSSLAGVDFYYDNAFPSTYHDALFFADYSRDCIWSMHAGANGLPNPATISTFDAGASNPVFIEIGPDGALYYADFDGGRIQRVAYAAANQAPTAVATANRLNGPAPLTVNFSGAQSSDPNPGDSLTYAWDLDGDGAFDDSTAAAPSFTYTQPGSYAVKLRVTDPGGLTGTASLTIDVGNSPPTATILVPTTETTWSVGSEVDFEGEGIDPEQGYLPATALDWSLTMQHCPSNCHSHPIQSWPDIDVGFFNAPDHEYPSWLELTLTATDAFGLTDSETVRIDPVTVDVKMRSNLAGIMLGFNGSTALAPFTRTVIHGSANTISAPSPQTVSGTARTFQRWSDRRAQSHTVRPTGNTIYRATFKP